MYLYLKFVEGVRQTEELRLPLATAAARDVRYVGGHRATPHAGRYRRGHRRAIRDSCNCVRGRVGTGEYFMYEARARLGN